MNRDQCLLPFPERPPPGTLILGRKRSCRRQQYETKKRKSERSHSKSASLKQFRGSFCRSGGECETLHHACIACFLRVLIVRSIEQLIFAFRRTLFDDTNPARPCPDATAALRHGLLFSPRPFFVKIYSEDGSVRSHKNSPRGGGRGVGSRGNSRHASRNGSTQALQQQSSHHTLQRQESLNPNGSPRARGAGARNAFVTAMVHSPRSTGFIGSSGGNGSGHGGHTARLSPRGVGGGASALPGYHHLRGGGPGGVAMGSPQETARSPRGGIGSGQNTGRTTFVGEEGAGVKTGAVGGSIFDMGNSHKQLVSPTARHQEARQRFENEMASKLMQVIDKKKLANLQVRADLVMCPCCFCPLLGLVLFVRYSTRDIE